MVSFVRFISGADHCDVVCPCAVALNQKRKGQCADVSAHAGTACNADDQRHPETVGKIVQIFEPQHQVGFLVADCIVRDKIIVSQVLLRLFQFDHSNGCFRGGSEKLLPGVSTARSKTCCISAVPAVVCGGNQCKRLFGTESGIDLLLCVFTAIREIPGRSTALYCLIPDGCNPRGAVKIPEDIVCIVDPAIHKTDQDSVPF